MWLNKNHSTIMPPGTPKIHANRYFIENLRLRLEQGRGQSYAPP